MPQRSESHSKKTYRKPHFRGREGKKVTGASPEGPVPVSIAPPTGLLKAPKPERHFLRPRVPILTSGEVAPLHPQNARFGLTGALRYSPKSPPLACPIFLGVLMGILEPPVPVGTASIAPSSWLVI